MVENLSGRSFIRCQTLTALAACLSVAIASPNLSWSGVLDDVGYTALQAELGAATPNGTGVSITQVEAPSGPDRDQYVPDETNAEFTGKTINVIGETAPASNHATVVGRSLYGLTTSAGSGITDINVYAVDPFLQDELLGFGSGVDPLVETQDIQNHSWIGTFDLVDQDVNALQRLDFVINRDDVTVVVALNNGSASGIPPLLANSFNSIVTGVTDGDHSTGRATVESPSRQVPHIVAPDAFTSFANPVIAAGAAVLLETARSDASLNAADRNEVVRSLLLAGATKDEFAAWSHTPTEPLDDHFGAGELHIQRSYHILTAGQQTPGGDSDALGWDLQSAATGTQTYFFDIPDGGKIEEFSALLTWNRELVDTTQSIAFTPSYSGLNDLNLRLYTADDSGTLDTMLAESISTTNIEHIYVNEELEIGTPLTGGRYAIVVEGGANAQDYAISWFSRFAPLGCDFDGDGDCDPVDLAELYAKIGTADALYDVDGSGTVDAADISGWLASSSVEANPFNVDGLTFVVGDVNFNGVVDSSDLGLLLNSFGDSTGLGYGSGDLNGDEMIDSSDLGLILNNFGFSSIALPTSASAAVPEPSHLGWGFLIFAAFAARHRRRRS